MAHTFNTLKDLYVAQLKDLYSAESQFADALPKMRDAATNTKLRDAFANHLDVTKRQKERLGSLIEGMGESPTGETCQAAKGLVKEGESMIEANGDDDVRDAGLIAAAQRVEHYEITGYGSVVAFARQLGREDDATTLQEILNEEYDADNLLDQIAQGTINEKAEA